MTLNDTLANALSVVMHSERIGRTECTIFPASRLIRQVLSLLQDAHYLGSFTEQKDRKGDRLRLNLLGTINRCGVVKPRFSVEKDGYERMEQRYLPARSMGVLIVSTNQGLMTNRQAKEKRIGGRLIAYCY